MKRKLSTTIVAILMLAAATVLFFSMSALAEKDEMITVVPDVDLPDNDELFSMYVESLFYDDFYSDIMPFGTGTHTAGARLTGDDKKIYDVLVPYIKQIASGKRASARIEVGKEVTFENSNYSHQDLIDSNVFKALYTDYPYEMYWAGRNYYAGWTGTPNSIYVFFTPAVDYDISTDQKDPKVDTSKTSAAAAAAENAKKVVADNAGKSDYEKLCAYKDYICGAVSYDNNANEYISMNSWELIHVFDGKPNTNVVCEGYSKAFQYLCDMTTWSSSEVQCYSVSGTMTGGTGAGPHMWNIVTLDGKHYYLVDVTNSDSGTIGGNGGLFMAGTAGSVDAGYTFSIGNSSVSYVYDRGKTDMVSIWGREVLTLASSDYNTSQKEFVQIQITTPPTKTTYVEGEMFDAAGMVVTAIYSDGSAKTVTNYKIIPNNVLVVGDTSMTVCYTEDGVTDTASQSISVKGQTPVVLTGITITTPPAKTAYQEGEMFDATGMVVTASYSDGSTKQITNYETVPNNALAASDTSMEIRYTEGNVTKSTMQPIKVASIAVASYTATVNNGTGSGTYAEGASVSIAANAPEAGKRFAGWTGLEGLTITIGAAANTQLTFTMPARDVTVSAVYEDAAVPVSGITLNESQIDLTVGGAFNLIATVLPDDAANKNVIWSNSNPAVATFTEGSAARAATSAREGVVTALAAGSTVITVKTEDGGFAATCKVTVSAQEKPLSVDASGSQMVSVRKGDTVEMSVVVSGGVAPYKYQWYISRNNEPFVAYEGSTSATHATTSVDESNSGYRYFCRVTDSNGQTFDSPIFTLDVVEKTDLPDTGDHRQLGLWLMLCVMGLAGVSILLRRTRKAQN